MINLSYTYSSSKRHDLIVWNIKINIISITLKTNASYSLFEKVETRDNIL